MVMSMKKQQMSEIPVRDVFVLRDIVQLILEDEDLRRGFNRAVASTAEMKRAVKILNRACDEHILDELNTTAKLFHN